MLKKKRKFVQTLFLNLSISACLIQRHRACNTTTEKRDRCFRNSLLITEKSEKEKSCSPLQAFKLSASAARGGVAVYARINVKTKVRLVKYLKECSPVSSFLLKSKHSVKQ